MPPAVRLHAEPEPSGGQPEPLPGPLDPAPVRSYVRISDVVEQLTHARARQRLDALHFRVAGHSVDRRTYDYHVQDLRRMMLTGEFNYDVATIITCVCDEAVEYEEGLFHPPGSEYGQDGKHTCTGCLLVPEELLGRVRFMKYQAATLEGMRSLYRTIDHGMGRTSGNTVSAVLGGRDQFRGLAEGMLANMIRGLVSWQYPDGTMSIRSRSCLLAACDHALTDLARVTLRVTGALREFPRDDGHRTLYRHVGVIAAMFETFNVAPPVASTFWTMVITGVNLPSTNDPRCRLNHYLNTAYLGQGNRIPAGQFPATNEELYRVCIKAWNAHRARRTPKSIRLKEAEVVSPRQCAV